MSGIMSNGNSHIHSFGSVQRPLNPGVGLQRKATKPKMKMRVGNHLPAHSFPATLRSASRNLHNTDSLIKDLARGTVKKGCSACGRG